MLQNYSILNVYFSDAAGSPSNICESNGPFYISILYTSNASSPINNVRIIADILKRDRNDPEGDPLDEYYINEFLGTLNPCTTGTCYVTLEIPNITIDCLNEFYELSRPLVAWTPGRGNSKNLEDAYDCQDYPAAQCLNQPTIPIEVGTLAYSFGPVFDCYIEDNTQTNVSFVITSLFGGNPTNPYNLAWEFEFSDGTVQTSTVFNPALLNQEQGTIIDVSLVVTQGTLIGTEVTQTVTVPIALLSGDVIESVERTNTIEGDSTGVIDVTLAAGDYFFYWTSLDDVEFYSEETRIDSLPVGTYQLTTIDNTTGTCRIDQFDISPIILPVELTYHNAHHNTKTRTSLISWATGKEWESSHFEIERALNGVEFEKIGEVMAMGFKDSITEYEFMDEDLPLSGGNVLYRLKQVDMNGNYVYSPVMSVRTSGIEFTSGVWRAYPNPTNGNQLRISLLDRAQYEEEKITFRLVHPSAQSQLMAVASEEEMNAALAQMVGRIPKGVFVVEIQWGQKVEHIKVLKQ
jgi:hypothetical protein